MTNQPHSGRSGCRGTLAASSASEGRDGITDGVMLAQRLCVVALLLSLAVLVVPVKGSDVLGSGESLNCGPASTAAIGLTRPELPDEPIMWPGSDLGIGRAPGTDPITSYALRHGGGGVSDDAVAHFPQYVDDVLAMMSPAGVSVICGSSASA